MAYTTVSAVQQDFKGITFLAAAASPTSLVTVEAVTQFIVEADALINSYVGSRWTVPVTADASSLALMSLYSRTLVATRVRGILQNKQSTNVDGNQEVKADGISVKDVMEALKSIRDGNMQLTGATLLLATAGFFSNNNQNSISPRFKKNVKQW